MADKCDRCGGAWHGGSPCTSFTSKSVNLPAVVAEVATLRGALDFIQSLAEEELPFARVGTGHEVALRHIERRAREALGSPRFTDETPG